MVKLTDIWHPGFRAVCREIRRLAETYAGDLPEWWVRLSAHDAFRQVEAIPYQSDTEILGNSEILGRPALLFWRGDCKKKTILLGAWAQRNGIPWVVCAVDDRGVGYPTHVFPALDLADGLYSMDATIEGLFVPGQSMPWLCDVWTF